MDERLRLLANAEQTLSAILADIKDCSDEFIPVTITIGSHKVELPGDIALRYVKHMASDIEEEFNDQQRVVFKRQAEDQAKKA